LQKMLVWIDQGLLKVRMPTDMFKSEEVTNVWS
jgi:hypothetical protein